MGGFFLWQYECFYRVFIHFLRCPYSLPARSFDRAAALHCQAVVTSKHFCVPNQDISLNFYIFYTFLNFLNAVSRQKSVLSDFFSKVH